MSIITVLTDFGLKDAYVGAMKGVILSLDPRARIVDITHEIEPQDIREACFVLRESFPYFPAGSIHLCVVDPTVGSPRRPLAVRRKGHFFVGPDNGLFTGLFDGDSEVREICNPRFMRPDISNTFHGRDIFGPVSAYLSLGARFANLGPVVDDPFELEDLHPRVVDDELRGTIVRFDRFGNAISNVSADDMRGFLKSDLFSITVGEMRFASINKSYFEQPLACLVGSSGYLEFGSFRGNFREQAGIAKGEEVILRNEER